MTRRLHAGIYEDQLTSAQEAEISARTAEGWWVDVASTDSTVRPELLARPVYHFLRRALEYIAADPVWGVRPNRHPKRVRFLSRDEIERLHEALDRHAGRHHPPAADRVPQERDPPPESARERYSRAGRPGTSSSVGWKWPHQANSCFLPRGIRPGRSRATCLSGTRCAGRSESRMFASMIFAIPMQVRLSCRVFPFLSWHDFRVTAGQ